MIGESNEAKLIYENLVDGQIVDVETNVFATMVDIYGNEFYLSYQSGINVQCAFEVNGFDFDETKHIEAETQRPKYATKILYEGAKYDIVRHQSIKNTEKVLLICS